MIYGYEASRSKLVRVEQAPESDLLVDVVGIDPPPSHLQPHDIPAPQLDDRFKTVINSYCSAKPGLSAMSKWAFRNTLTSDKQLKPVVDAWLKDYKIKKVLRLDLTRKIRDGEAFLKKNPNGIEGIPAELIRRGIANNRELRASLARVNCPVFADDPSRATGR